jgi:hypothetical protein
VFKIVESTTISCIMKGWYQGITMPNHIHGIIHVGAPLAGARTKPLAGARQSRMTNDNMRATGDDNRATEDNNRATGDDNRATGDDNRATGDDNRATGDDNRATGDNNRATARVAPTVGTG